MSIPSGDVLMKKIQIPISGDTLLKVFISSIMVLLMVAVGLLQYIAFMHTFILSWVLGIALFGLHWVFLLMLFMVNEKDEWADFLIPFETR